MGREPILPPNLNEILKITRKVLPRTNLTIYTNGILLSEQKESIWKTCKKYNIGIAISPYPLKIDFRFAHYKSKKYNVLVNFYDGNIKKLKRCLS